MAIVWYAVLKHSLHFLQSLAVHKAEGRLARQEEHTRGLQHFGHLSQASTLAEATPTLLTAQGGEGTARYGTGFMSIHN